MSPKVKTSLVSLAALAAALVANPAHAGTEPTTDDAAESSEASGQGKTDAAPTAGAQVFTPDFFARFSPKTAGDMVANLPGFQINGQDQGRGLGQANVNVLIDGERLALKSESVFDRLGRIPAAKVVRIEIIDGATLGIPGLSGQVANIVTSGGGFSGQFEWNPRFRPGYVRDRWLGGEVSVNGTSGNLGYTLSLSNQGGTGAAKGDTLITDGDGDLIETRYNHLQITNDHPKIAGTLKWDGPGALVANLNASYQRGYFDLHDDEIRTRPDGSVVLKDYDPRERSFNYEFGGDVEFPVGPGKLKLIGLERYERSRYSEDYVLTPQNGDPQLGSRYSNVSESGERIARAEYSWGMAGGDWQLAGEAAFNRFDIAARLFDLDSDGTFVEIPYPEGTGGVTEDRYEMILTHSRKLAPNLSFQLGIGGEYSRLSQSGASGLIREFWRPKGSASLAWTPSKGFDISLKLARKVGQLSFGDFLARVDLDQGNDRAGNAELVPPQSWEADLEFKKDLSKWGSTTLKLQARWYQDFIDWVVFPGENEGELIEARGNVPKARLYGIDWVSTINFDPVGWKGAKLDLHVNVDRPSIEDPLTGQKRRFSGWNDTYISGALRWDIPKSDWAMGGGFDKFHANPYYRLREIGLNYEGPVYTYAFVENKDVFGLTVRADVFNLTDGRRIIQRTVYDGYRNDAPVLFHEDADQSVGPIYQLSVKGSF